MRRTITVLTLTALCTVSAAAQVVVYDPAVTARNVTTAAIKQLLAAVEGDERRQLEQMARRLSLLTGLGKYAVPDSPRWLTHGGDVLFTQAFNDALTFGDTVGAAYQAMTHPLAQVQDLLARLPPAARNVVAARLATLNMTDAAVIAATNDTGLLRLNGRRREQPAIDALEADVINPSNEQSASAVLDKISGASLLADRQRQARVQLLSGVVEQLLVDTKRARDSDAAAMNMQLVTWRDGRAANEAFVAGTGDALRTWRQP